MMKSPNAEHVSRENHSETGTVGRLQSGIGGPQRKVANCATALAASVRSGRASRRKRTLMCSQT